MEKFESLTVSQQGSEEKLLDKKAYPESMHAMIIRSAKKAEMHFNQALLDLKVKSKKYKAAYKRYILNLQKESFRKKYFDSLKTEIRKVINTVKPERGRSDRLLGFYRPGKAKELFMQIKVELFYKEIIEFAERSFDFRFSYLSKAETERILLGCSNLSHLHLSKFSFSTESEAFMIKQCDSFRIAMMHSLFHARKSSLEAALASGENMPKELDSTSLIGLHLHSAFLNQEEVFYFGKLISDPCYNSKNLLFEDEYCFVNLVYELDRSFGSLDSLDYVYSLQMVRELKSNCVLLQSILSNFKRRSKDNSISLLIDKLNDRLNAKSL